MITGALLGSCNFIQVTATIFKILRTKGLSGKAPVASLISANI
jgi:hypothetical protein